MIQFTQPIALWAITAVAIPIIIHLWNIREGKTLKIGSTAFLTEATRSHARSVKLSELLLLILRCLLLILIALLLARPVWTDPVKSNQRAGWILIPPSLNQQAYRQFRPAIDSLLRSGYQLHRLETGFGNMTAGENFTGSTGMNNYWQLIMALDRQLPAGTLVYLFTDNQRRHFSGQRPATTLQLHWQTFSLPDTVSWTEARFRTNKDSTRIITANSSSAGTFYRALNSAGIDSDTSSMNVCIYTDNYSADANYLRAAIAAIRDFTQRNIKIGVVNNASVIPATTDWLFWLSDRPLQQRSAKHVFAYGPGRIRALDEEINATAGIQNLNVYRIKDNAVPLLPVWTAGDRILLGQEAANPQRYQFNSRFDPQWSGLVWHDQFPQLIAGLLLDNDPRVDSRSLVAIDPQQLQPQLVNEELILPKEKTEAALTLDTILWLLAMAVLLIERLISFQTKRRRV
ncbi:MAG: BatA domain-containing protein [Chitinophagaceae bacterium]|nr:BatA domain-containing protein [Chitinophagaceae bacterium]